MWWGDFRGEDNKLHHCGDINDVHPAMPLGQPPHRFGLREDLHNPDLPLWFYFDVRFHTYLHAYEPRFRLVTDFKRWAQVFLVDLTPIWEVRGSGRVIRTCCEEYRNEDMKPYDFTEADRQLLMANALR